MLRRNQASASAQQGFTLIEVMVALTIMTIGVLSIGVAQLSALRISSMSSRLSQAMYLAEEQMETFRSMPWERRLDMVESLSAESWARPIESTPTLMMLRAIMTSIRVKPWGGLAGFLTCRRTGVS